MKTRANPHKTSETPKPPHNKMSKNGKNGKAVRAAGRRLRPSQFSLLLTLGLALALTLAACSSTATVSAPTPLTTTSATSATTPTVSLPTATPTASGYHVLVYFSKHPDSDSNPSIVLPVNRYSPTLSVATYAINQLIAGPTASEQAAGYYTPLPSSLSGASTCGGPDFTITLNMRASTPEPGTATLRFCRQTMLPGDLTGAYITSEMQRTLTQFATIHTAIILTANGACFDDLSGLNRCLTP